MKISVQHLVSYNQHNNLVLKQAYLLSLKVLIKLTLTLVRNILFYISCKDASRLLNKASKFAIPLGDKIDIILHCKF